MTSSLRQPTSHIFLRMQRHDLRPRTPRCPATSTSSRQQSMQRRMITQSTRHIHVQRRAMHHLTAASSPALEARYLAQHSRFRNGADLLARMSPRVQLIAAEEGLSPWSTTSLQKNGEDGPKMKLAEQTGAVQAVVTRETNESLKADGYSAKADASLSRRAHLHRPAARTERDDTPGVVAFLALLALPLGYWVGTRVERRRHEDQETLGGLVGNGQFAEILDEVAAEQSRVVLELTGMKAAIESLAAGRLREDERTRARADELIRRRRRRREAAESERFASGARHGQSEHGTGYGTWLKGLFWQ